MLSANVPARGEPEGIELGEMGEVGISGAQGESAGSAEAEAPRRSREVEADEAGGEPGKVSPYPNPNPNPNPDKVRRGA